MAFLKDDHGWRCRICLVERLVGRRAQAALTAGVLAMASVAPTAAFAQQGAVEGSAAPDAAPADFDIGSTSDDLGEEDGGEAQADGAAPPTPKAPPAAVTAPTPRVEPAGPAPEAAAPEVPDVAEPDPGEDSAEAPAPAPEDESPAPATPPDPAPAPVTTQSGPETETETSPEAEDVVEPRKRPARSKRPERRPGGKVRDLLDGAPTPPVAERPVTPDPSAPPVPAAVPPAPASTAAPAPARPKARATRGWHVVQRGESLWTIAAEQLGGRASTASIAQEVERLWWLNATRIGTGDRNVLIAGTKIKL